LAARAEHFWALQSAGHARLDPVGGSNRCKAKARRSALINRFSGLKIGAGASTIALDDFIEILVRRSQSCSTSSRQVAPLIDRIA